MPSVPVFAADTRPSLSGVPDHDAIGSSTLVTSLATLLSIERATAPVCSYTTSPSLDVAFCTKYDGRVMPPFASVAKPTA